MPSVTTVPAPLRTTTSGSESAASAAARAIRSDWTSATVCAGQPGELAGMRGQDDRVVQPGEQVGLAGQGVEAVGVDDQRFTGRM